MSKLDLIYCYTCNEISFDDAPIKIQDSRFNPKWTNRCPYCLGFKTINATMFLMNGKRVAFKQIAKSRDLVALKTEAKKLKASGIIKGYYIETRRPINILYEKKYLQKEIRQAIRKYVLEQESK